MRSFIKFLFGKKYSQLGESEAMKKYLVAGLGNIGEEYAGTRHNVGFQILNMLAEEKEFRFSPARLGDIGTFKIKGRSVLCLKPSTYMNRSGKAIRYWLDMEKIPLENLLIIADDINLPFGTIRLKTKGSDGGHNGLRDIQEVLQTTNYHRFRFGVGSEFTRGNQVNYVLGKWNEEEMDAMGERLKRSVELVYSFVLSGARQTMNEFNGT